MTLRQHKIKPHYKGNEKNQIGKGFFRHNYSQRYLPAAMKLVLLVLQLRCFFDTFAVRSNLRRVSNRNFTEFRIERQQLMKFRINWDALGIGASLACAIHCALLPIFLIQLPLFGMNIIENQPFEVGMIILALLIGSIPSIMDTKSIIIISGPLVVFLIGFFFLVMKQFFPQYETWFFVPAVILIISAHLFNYRFCQVHHHAHSDDCDH